jgi:hypothetical protein
VPDPGLRLSVHAGLVAAVAAGAIAQPPHCTGGAIVGRVDEAKVLIGPQPKEKET